MLRFAAIAASLFLLPQCASLPSSTARSEFVPSVASNAGPRCPKYGKGTGILSDGDFHAAVDPGASYLTFNAGQKLAPSWKATLLDVNLIGTQFWNFDHLCSVDLDGESAVGAIAHTPFPTHKGSKYDLAFLLSGNSYCGPIVKKMNVSVAGHSTLFKWNVSNGHDVESGVVAPRRLTFTAAGSTSTLAFTSLDKAGSGCGPVIGAVSVTAAP